MFKTDLDREWTFRRGYLDSIGIIESDPGIIINLPHDGMIGTSVRKDAPSRSDMGYFTGDLTNYTKMVMIPKEWQDECVGLSIDGAMMNATVDVNGCKITLQHYGYAPFYVNLTDYVTFGEENRITINTNTSMQPNSRWYTGSGLFRGVKLCHGPKVHAAEDGIFVYTKEVEGQTAYLEAQIDVENDSEQNCLAKVSLRLMHEGTDETVKICERVIQVNARSSETARMAFTLSDPVLWDAENPNLYRAVVTVKNMGAYRTHFIAAEHITEDESSVLFGIRTVTADAIRGLRINGKAVKLKGGCLHHDNGLLGSVSLYESEVRKITKLKELGFNAVRTTHNPPSLALIEACDRVGMYIFDEAFDAWGIGKRGGDYSQFFENCWERDLTAFVKRDRSQPSVIIWSIGNEIPERGGLNNGYTLATRLAETVRSLDGTRPVSNGICSLWCGLDDELAKTQSLEQNSNICEDPDRYEKVTEPFTNGLDIVGYNYYEIIYEKDHEMFPERVILGSENFPKEVGFNWPLVESLPYVIGEFTWTAWDYLGEAGIGKAVYVDKDDPAVERGPWGLMPPDASPYPWRTANDADFDITGVRLPQGNYRSVVWGDCATYLYVKHPMNYDKVEIVSPWGFPSLIDCWNFEGYEDKPIEVVVFSNADEVELLINGKSIGRKAVSKEKPLPNSVSFDAKYKQGTVEAISYVNQKEVSRTMLATAGKPAQIKLLPEKNKVRADGHDLAYVGIEICDEQGRRVPNVEIALKAEVGGAMELAGFGTGNPITDENYTDNDTVSYCGRAMAILRAGYAAGEAVLTVSASGMPNAVVSIEVV